MCAYNPSTECRGWSEQQDHWGLVTWPHPNSSFSESLKGMRVEGDRVGLWHCGFCVLTHVYPTWRGRGTERALLWELGVWKKQSWTWGRSCGLWDSTDHLMLVDILREAGIKKMPSVCPRSMCVPFSVIPTAISVLCLQYEEHPSSRSESFDFVWL